MNVTFFTPTLKLSGGNIVMFKYAEALVKFGHNVTVIAPHSDIIDKIENGVHIKTFKKISNKYFEHIFFQLIYLNKFFNLVPQSDVIIPVFFPLVIHAIYCKNKGKTKKVISLFQDFKEMFWFGNYIFFLLKIRLITNQIDKFIAVSHPIAEEIKKYSRREVTIIPNGVEHEYFYPRNFEKENYILFVGSSAKNKGLEYFIQSFKLVKKDFPELKAKIVSQNNENIIDDDIEVVNIGNDRNLLGEIYSKALIFVSQSIGDSFGLPPLEAMACGTAVVLTDTVGSREYAKDRYNSIIVPIKDVNSTVKAIKTYVEDKNLRLKIEQNGLKTAEKYNWKHSIEKFHNVLLALFIGDN